jgi:hypothetical protein
VDNFISQVMAVADQQEKHGTLKKLDVGTLEEELIKLKNGWPNYRFKKRRSLINFAIQEVIIDVMSTHWMRVEVLWLHQEWGREEMYYRREQGNKKEWSEEEIAIVLEHYATMSKALLMVSLPNRGWAAIQKQAKTQGLSRPMGRPVGETVGGDFSNSYSDLIFLRKENMPDHTTHTNWNMPSAR